MLPVVIVTQGQADVLSRLRYGRRHRLRTRLNLGVLCIGICFGSSASDLAAWAGVSLRVMEPQLRQPDGRKQPSVGPPQRGGVTLAQGKRRTASGSQIAAFYLQRASETPTPDPRCGRGEDLHPRPTRRQSAALVRLRRRPHSGVQVPVRPNVHRPVTEGYCVVATRGGELPEVNDPSVTT